MGTGVFGKLPARRDYVQHGIDPRLMQLLDPWLQRAVSDSRRELGDGWLDAYLQSPIWRFWLGPRIVGRTVLGALMPSVDGVGRYFPLCVVGAFETPVAPPEIDEHTEWFAAVEALLLETLSDGGSYEALLAGAGALPPPRYEVVVPDDGLGVRGMFATLRHTAMGPFYDRFSCWWVPSPDDGATPPRALLRQGLPAPMEYASMIAPDGEPAAFPAVREA